MRCKVKPPPEETITCSTCVTPWHVACLTKPPETLASSLSWLCPDCSGVDGPALPSGGTAGDGGDLVAAIRAIEADEKLTDKEKARKRQELLSGKVEEEMKENENEKKSKGKERESDSDVLDLLDGSLNCSFCMQLPERPVTAPCGHNFCLKCFQKWIGQGKRTCAKCRHIIPPKMASQPRINSALVTAIRMAKLSKSNLAAVPTKVYHFMRNQDRPDKAFTTERAQKTGKANAASGKIFVTIPPDHFGPIPAENDPERNQGVLVGECWEDRLECRQWGAHFPHVAGIAGQSNYGSQSVALSGGYEDDEDHGEWFLYTGSGGRDLSGNKRTNKEQSFDQKFEKMNEALRVSCKKGYPVRVVRSHKEKRSSYAPEKGVRYDGVYRIEKCWRKIGIQVCRYLFVRCDNEPAPWTSDEFGDRPRSLPGIPELKMATDVTERKESPAWDFDEEDSRWKWKKPPPLSKKPIGTGKPEDGKKVRRAIRQAQNTSVREKLLKEFSCLICRQVMNLPITTPCAHNFCKSCLEGAFAGKTFVRERSRGGRTLRSQKNVMQCPSCPTDISEFLQNPQVNRELMDVIESLKHKTEENEDPPEELSDEEINGMENPNPTSGITGTAATENFENADVKEDLQNSPAKPKPKRASKRMKLDSGGSSSFDGSNEEENRISVEKPGCSNGDSKVKKVESGVPKGLTNDGDGSVKQNVGLQSRSRKIPAATADEGDSPASTLQLQSSDEDFE
ncbi:E3 ubiquitin-protein ligase ORTHRUS 2 [Citrus sinensis]|nr:E3 ubiquitin-protein ligase ORTHRUS 2 [Citrus sinensis]